MKFLFVIFGNFLISRMSRRKRPFKSVINYSKTFLIKLNAIDFTKSTFWCKSELFLNFVPFPSYIVSPINLPSSSISCSSCNFKRTSSGRSSIFSLSGSLCWITGKDCKALISSFVITKTDEQYYLSFIFNNSQTLFWTFSSYHFVPFL